MAAAAVLPASAAASPLLSGYGGPGQGNQALLGSTLINGPKGGGSGGAGTSTGTGLAESSESSSEGRQVSGGGSGSSKGGGTGSSSARHASARRGVATTTHGKAPTPAAAPSFYPAAERLPADSQGGSLGLSGSDVLFIVLAAALLVSLGLLTRRAGDSRERGSTGG
ncbi:MAG: hypothetical protein ACYDHT_09835 [Solirubrobacteraceae bacterium]